MARVRVPPEMVPESPPPVVPQKGEGLFRPLDEVYEDAYHNRQFTPVYLMMLVLAALIALLGLQLNSPAIIIGAMLISPMMGPILSCGLALTLGDWPLGRKAARNVGLSVVEAIGITTLAGLLSPLKDATPEMLARINPSLMDLLVAFFSGVAGTLALVSRTKSGLTIIPGVAIATAVMPPLATTGFGIATGQWEIARGSFMLFFTNLMAIVISADLVFLAVGFRPLEHMGEKHKVLVKYRFTAAGLILIVLSIPLTHTLIRAAQQARMRKEITTTLRARLEEAQKTRVSSMEFSSAGTSVVVDAAVRTTQLIPLATVRDVEKELGARLGRQVDLQLQQIRVADELSANEEISREQDFVAGGTVRPAPRREPEPTPGDLLAQVQGRIQFLLSWLLQPMEVDSITINSMGRKVDKTMLIDISGRQARPTNADAWRVAASALATELKSSVHLRGRIITVAEAEHVVQFRPKSAVPAPADLRKVAELIEEWKQRPDLKMAFAPSPEAPAEVSAQRLAALTKRFRGVAAAQSLLAYDLEPDLVRFYLVQDVDVVGRPGPQPAPPATPGEESSPPPPAE